MTHGFDRKKDAGELTRQDALARISKLSRSCRIVCTFLVAMIAVGLLAVVVIEAFLVAPTLSQGARLQAVDPATGGEALVSLVGTSPESGLMLVARDGHTALGAVAMAAVWLLVALSARRLFAFIEKSGRPFELAAADELDRIGRLLVAGGCCANILGALATGALLAALGGNFTDAFGGQLIEVAMVVSGLVVSLLASVFRYGCVLQEQDDELI